ncbi:MAG: hypothetical protein LBT05_09545 [Planctomycetaceae bacterium]|jgi:hypothetical protein|nr:hypothetical protein [Planctomycetaceae bacterium]
MDVTKVPKHGYLSTVLFREWYGGKVKSHTSGNITLLDAEKIALIYQVFKEVDFVPTQFSSEILRSRPHVHIGAIFKTICKFSRDKIFFSFSFKSFYRLRLLFAVIAQRIIFSRSKTGIFYEWNFIALAYELNINTKNEDKKSFRFAKDRLFKRNFTICIKPIKKRRFKNKTEAIPKQIQR